MTIREVEEQLGMTRANIRFYEKEDLLSPKRDPNGYRDYTPEDVETLRKIKLLRQLKLPVEVIRQVQRGERTLDSAIQSQEAQLEKERRDLEWAEEICRAMRADHANYETLDAKRYLERLDRSPEAPGYFNLKEDEAPTVSHPWRRYFARAVDTGLYGLLWTAVRLLLLRWNPSGGLLSTLLESYITFGLMLVIEPVLLCTWGYTPGKWIFGLRVRTLRGDKLSFGDAWFRTFGVFTRGFGWGLPIYNIVRLVKCCKACSNGEPMDWEWENGEEAYTIRDTRVWRCAAFVAADAAVMGLAALLALQAYMPIHPGPLTPAQYAENINDIVNFQHLSLNGMNRSMDENGRWVGVQPALDLNGFITLSSSLPPHYLTVEDGVVTGVRIELEETETQIISAATVQKQLAALALAAAQREYNCVSWASSGVLKTIEKNAFDNYTLQAGGMTIRQECSWTGYQVIGDCLFAGNEAENLSYHLIFTIETADG